MTPKPSQGFVVPSSYAELYTQYGAFIHRLLVKRNKVERNLDELKSEVWVRLLEANFLERFQETIAVQTPKVISTLGACDLLGVSIQQWSAAMRAYHRGVEHSLSNGRATIRLQGSWMPTPINAVEFDAQGITDYVHTGAIFAFNDIIQLTLDERLSDGSIQRAFEIRGQMIDAQGNVVQETRPEGEVKIPTVKVTRAQFRNYLAMSVLNRWSNFCRTEERRHKERPVIPPAYLRDQDDAPSWESNLEDTRASDADTILALAEARRLLSETIYDCCDGVTTCKPVSEHETEVFMHLENGSSLMQALRESELPPRVRAAVLDTIRPLASDF